MAKEKILWACIECGHQQPKWAGSCGVCQKWNTFQQEVEMIDKGKRFDVPRMGSAKPLRVREVSAAEHQRIRTQMPEVDRLLGGGIVRGSLALVAGDPGIGKSTLMLQIAQQ